MKYLGVASHGDRSYRLQFDAVGCKESFTQQTGFGMFLAGGDSDGFRFSISNWKCLPFYFLHKVHGWEGMFMCVYSDMFLTVDSWEVSPSSLFHMLYHFVSYQLSFMTVACDFVWVHVYDLASTFQLDIPQKRLQIQELSREPVLVSENSGSYDLQTFLFKGKIGT